MAEDHDTEKTEEEAQDAARRRRPAWRRYVVRGAQVAEISEPPARETR